jgi:hypothetical protein
MIRKVLLLGVAALAVGASAAYAFPPIDLATTAGATYTSTDGTYWQHNQNAPTGTGVFGPFLRLRADGTEEGMNTDGDKNNTYDDVSSIHTHGIQFGELQIQVNPDGAPAGSYYLFTLDINEPNGGELPYVSLDEIKIYTLANAGGSTLMTTGAVIAAGGILRYDMDAVTDQDVYLNHALLEGSGHDDMSLYIPVSYFAGAANTDWIYFYTKMGDTVGLEANFESGDGFEEWSAAVGPNTPTGQLPEPSTVMLLGTGLLGLAATRIRKK